MTKQQYMELIDKYKEIASLVFDINELIEDHINISATDSNWIFSDKNNVKDRYREVVRKSLIDMSSLLQEVGVFKYNFTRLTKDNRTYNSTELLPACVIKEIFDKLGEIEKGLIIVNKN